MTRTATALLAGLAVATAAAADAGAEPADAGALMRQAIRSAQAGHLDAALPDMEAAVAQRPRHPAYLYNLACLQSLAGQGDAALATLTQLADFGVETPAAADGDFAAIKADPRFAAVCAHFAANRAPRGHAEVAFSLPAQSGIIEGIAFRPASGDTFFGDMHHRAVWRRDRAGRVSRFTADDARLAGIGGLAIDEARGRLWAASCASPVMAGWTTADADRGGLARFDLQTGALVNYYPLPADGRHHATADLTVAPDGTVYLADSAAPVIWQLVPGASALTTFVDDPRLRSLQGLALSADGKDLFAADYVLGLFRIARNDGTITPLDPPAGTTLVGIDGLVRAGHALVAVQNGVQPRRVIAIDLAAGAPVRVRMLASAWPGLTDPTLACVDGADVLVVGHAGWDRFDAGERADPTHDVPIFRVRLSD